jgi:recombination protein RecA
MPTAAALRLQIERALEGRFQAALSAVPRTIHEVWATGIAGVDELLGGGLPGGAISEVTGPASSGRTSLALAFVAQRTKEGRACAWVDGCDAFDPESAAANGVRLKQLLWVRCRNGEQGNKGTRERERSLSPQVQNTRRPPKSWWTRLEQGLRATDLLLQAGGFSCVVLDLGDSEPEQASRIPLTTWFRYRQAVERTQCSLIVLGKRAYAQSAAGMVLECAAEHADAADRNDAEGTVLRGFTFTARRGRERFAPVEITKRKPPAATWQADAACDAVRDPERRRA